MKKKTLGFKKRQIKFMHQVAQALNEKNTEIQGLKAHLI
jgi:hypothetical protein